MTLAIKGQEKARSTLVYLGDDVRQEVTLLPHEQQVGTQTQTRNAEGGTEGRT